VIAGPNGLGFRVPLLVCSPFSRRGFVSSQVFDHTSLLLFLERRFHVEVPNISAWRRHTVGDLTAALNMAAVNRSVPPLTQPSLGDTRVWTSDCPTSAPSDLIDAGLPTVAPYKVPQPNKLPGQEPGKSRAPSGLSCVVSQPAAPSGSTLSSAAGVAAVAATGLGAFLLRRERLRSGTNG
jgi:phospholipase C